MFRDSFFNKLYSKDESGDTVVDSFITKLAVEGPSIMILVTVCRFDSHQEVMHTNKTRQNLVFFLYIYFLVFAR